MGDEEQLTQYSLEEVEKHNVGRGPDKSIWMVIHDKVFDVTKFLDEVRMTFEFNVNVFEFLLVIRSRLYLFSNFYTFSILVVKKF